MLLQTIKKSNALILHTVHIMLPDNAVGAVTSLWFCSSIQVVETNFACNVRDVLILFTRRMLF